MIPFLLLAIQTAAPPQLVVLDTPVGAREPQVAMHVRLPPEGSQGRAAVLHGCIHVAFGTPNAIYVSTSTDDAKTFEHPVRIAEVGRLALGMRRGPRIAVSDDWVVVTAIAGEEGGGRDGDLLCWRFRDDRTGVGPAVRLNPKPGAAREGLHAMASGPDDELCCVWIDLDGDSPRICCAVSRNSGETWGPPVVVQQDGGAICACRSEHRRR